MENRLTRAWLNLFGVAALFLATGTVHADSKYCVVVTKTSDGFLAVREKPSMKGKLIATIRPGFPPDRLV
jgi:hypothetical protein